MRIGILTQPLLANYGGLLQNHALQQVLLRNGHEVETIDHGAPASFSLHRWLYHAKKDLAHLLLPGRFSEHYRPTAEEQAVIRQHTDRFIANYLRRTAVCRSSEDFRQVAAERQYDAFVVGSDQCWRPCYNVFLEDMFLQFASDMPAIRRIAYAASFGTDVWELSPQQTHICAALAKKFDCITVREASAVGLCQSNLGVKATLVLDPTMLLDKDDYEALIDKECEPASPGTLFEYILDPTHTKSDFIQRIADQNSLTPFKVLPRHQREVMTKRNVRNDIEGCVYPSVTSWLRAFKDARMVVVDSFHGAVFSIIFNKPFWVIANAERGNARFDSLLKLFHLEDRLLSAAKLSAVEQNAPIDWQSVNNIRQQEKQRSLNLLLSALNVNTILTHRKHHT